MFAAVDERGYPETEHAWMGPVGGSAQAHAVVVVVLRQRSAR